MRKCDNCQKVGFDREFMVIDDEEGVMTVCVDEEGCEERALTYIREDPRRMLEFLCGILNQDDQEVIKQAISDLFEKIVERAQEILKEEKEADSEFDNSDEYTDFEDEESDDVFGEAY